MILLPVLGAQSEFNKLPVLRLIKLIFAWMCLCFSSLLLSSMSCTFYITHNTENVQMSTTETRHTAKEDSDKHLFVNIIEKREAVLSHFTSYTWVRQKTRPPPPEKSLKFSSVYSGKCRCLSLLSFISYSYVQRKSGVHEETLHSSNSHELQTGC